ncbi:hypothetical protein HMPREF0262_01628 [Clostridium sp. ATCC 29733]|nr:hypothetical protein HMPREF0262_01628 [Clostridium sp. ATCC 29733]
MRKNGTSIIENKCRFVNWGAAGVSAPLSVYAKMGPLIARGGTKRQPAPASGAG